MLDPEQPSPELLEDTIPDHWLFRLTVDAGLSSARFKKAIGKLLSPDKPPARTNPTITFDVHKPTELQFVFINLPKMTRTEAFSASLHEVDKLLRIGELRHPPVVGAFMISATDLAMDRIIRLFR
jgi:hypothetical protein